MTQILVTLENGADSTLIQRIIENIKGVFNTSVESVPSKAMSKEQNDWIGEIKSLTNSFNPELIDMDDERTRYIMSK